MKKVPAPKQGGRWPKAVRAKAVKLLREHPNATEVKKLLAETYEFVGHGPSRPTIVKWAQAAGIELVTDRPRDTSAATEERLNRLDEARGHLSEMLLARLSRPAVDLIASRLESAVEDDRVVVQARERFADAMTFEAQVRGDYAPDSDEVKAAKRSLQFARLDLGIALEAAIPLRDLVGVLTRAINDHLVLEGKGAEDVSTGDLIVELFVPRSDPAKSDAEAVPEGKLGELKVVDGGG